MSLADPFRGDGVLVVNKAPDMTSAEVVAEVKRLLQASKVGHAGTLDPFATGVLVCCINRATRLARFFLEGVKTYRAVLHLGIETDTQDGTGKIVTTGDPSDITEKQIRKVCQKFVGEYWQAPPRYSALKHHGKPLYHYARQGEPVQKPPRRVEIETIRLQSIQVPQVRFEVTCSAGTYIRTLCHDIGKHLGCGGHLKELARLESSRFRIEEAITLYRLRRQVAAGKAAERIIGMNKALRNLPELTAGRNLTEDIKNGRVVYKDNILPSNKQGQEGVVKIVDEQRRLIAILGYGKQHRKMQYHCVFNR